jgi:putative endonuclease
VRLLRLSYVYILASRRNGTLYVGSTSDIIKRIWEHKNNIVLSFTSKYHVHMLVYYEMHELYIEAARREKRFKNWPRQWKINLIEKLNPNWNDLYEEICQ